MRIPFRSQIRRSNHGSILLITLGFVVLCGVALGSYYMMAEQEHRTVVRSQSWNRALCLAEAGVDEALAQMNASPGNFSANGWGSSGGNYGPVTRSLGGGTYTTYIASGTAPTIYSAGYASVADTSQTVSRRVKVVVSPLQMSPFTVALGAVTNINMNGHQVITDSYNSTNTAQSVLGQYNSSFYVGTNGSIASVGGIVNIGQQTVDGNLYLGPTAVYDSSVSQILGTINYDYNVQFPVPTLPTTDSTGDTITWQNAPGTSSAHDFTQSGNYWVNDSGTITVEPGVSVTLNVTVQSFNPSSITIGGGITNAGSIVMYYNPPNPGASITLGGNASGGSIANRPMNFILFGLANVSTIYLGGTSTFQGGIYAPTAVLQMNGGGNSVNVMGSLIVGQATDNGHYYIHYDEALSNWVGGPNRGYIATSWQEL